MAVSSIYMEIQEKICHYLFCWLIDRNRNAVLTIEFFYRISSQKYEFQQKENGLSELGLSQLTKTNPTLRPHNNSLVFNASQRSGLTKVTGDRWHDRQKTCDLVGHKNAAEVDFYPDISNDAIFKQKYSLVDSA